jgi:hypothetical protein
MQMQLPYVLLRLMFKHNIYLSCHNNNFHNIYQIRLTYNARKLIFQIQENFASNFF